MEMLGRLPKEMAAKLDLEGCFGKAGRGSAPRTELPVRGQRVMAGEGAVCRTSE